MRSTGVYPRGSPRGPAHPLVNSERTFPLGKPPAADNRKGHPCGGLFIELIAYKQQIDVKRSKALDALPEQDQALRMGDERMGSHFAVIYDPCMLSRAARASTACRSA